MKFFYQNLKRLGLHPEGVSEGELNGIKEERNCDKKDGKASGVVAGSNVSSKPHRAFTMKTQRTK